MEENGSGAVSAAGELYLFREWKPYQYSISQASYPFLNGTPLRAWMENRRNTKHHESGNVVRDCLSPDRTVVGRPLTEKAVTAPEAGLAQHETT
jgi:hypothetical protein